LAAIYRKHLTFRRRGRESVDQREVWKIDFVERVPSSLITTPAGPDQITRGSVWIDPSAGTVVKTYLNVVISPTSQAKITVDYRLDAKLGSLVPTTMHESYERLSSRIVTTATYTNYRQFSTSARLVDSEK
jgi:hypothetical protein